MIDTFFEVPRNKKNRFLPNHYYDYKERSLKVVQETKEKFNAGSNYENVAFFSGGGGLDHRYGLYDFYGSFTKWRKSKWK